MGSTGHPAQTHPTALLYRDVWWQPVLHAVVQRLIRFAKRSHVVDERLRRDMIHQHTGDEIGDSLHLWLVHSQPCHLDGAHTQPTRAIPVGRLIAGDQVLVGDDVRARQSLRNLQPATKLAHIRNRLMRLCKALMAAQHRNPFALQGCPKP